MKLNHILKDLQNTTPESFERTEHRRDILKNLGVKMAAAAVPLFASAAFNKAQAKTTDILAEAIYYALSITNMQIAFYTEAMTHPALIPGDAMADFNKILNDKKAHAAYWNYVLVNTGNPAAPTHTYDFTAKNAFPKVFTEYADFLTLAHTLEDVGVRMYTQVVVNMVTNKALRGDAINIRCTMARHAGHVRLLTRNQNIDIMPWITGSDANTIVGELIQGYQGEEVTQQAQYSIVNINGAAVSAKAASQAFDEPMDHFAAEPFMAHFTKS